MTRTLHVLAYAAALVHAVAATWGIVLLYDHIGSSFGSAAPFYFVWSLTPIVILHLGLRTWGSPGSSAVILAAGSVVVACLTVWLVVQQFSTTPIGPLAMLMYIPLPLTEVLIIAGCVVGARSKSLNSASMA